MSERTAAAPTSTTSPVLLAAAWLVVGLPLAYGVCKTLATAAKLFSG